MTGVTRRATRVVAVVIAVGASLTLLSCGVPAALTPGPGRSLATIAFSPTALPTASPSTFSTPLTSAPPSVATGWPPGWDISFCAMFSDAVAAQELIVDIERAIDAGATRDAKGLARDLHDSASSAASALASLEPWTTASDALVELATLMDYDMRAADQYTRYFTTQADAALRQARNLRRQNADEVPAANEQLALIGDAGLACAGHPLEVESP